MIEGQTISHYRVLKHLGSGAMGVVCKAEDLLLHRTVALKTLSSSVLADSSHKRGLLDEARAACILDHPNICRVHHVEELSDGQVILVMSFYEGETVAEKISRSALDLPTAINIALQLLSGLHHAHGKGIIHRDIKPSNLIVNPDGEVKIVDFGLARRSNIARALTETGVIVGTIAYMAPEQVLSRPVDHRADLWAAGVVLYEMLAATSPFPGTTPYAVFDSILHVAPRPVTDFRADLPETLPSILERSLAKDPNQRFQDAAEFITALEPLAQARSSSRYTIALPTMLMDYRRNSDEPSIVVLPFITTPEDNTADYFCDGLTDEIITDLSSVHALRIICRASAMQLKGTRESPRKIARDLNVRYVLEGSVRLNKAAQNGMANIRVTTQLIDPESQSLVWADKYTGTLDDVFSIQENISRQIVSALKIKLSPAEDRQMHERPLPDAEAYRYYLMAKHEILNYSEDALSRALEYLEAGENIVGPNALLLATKGQVYWQYINAGISSDTEYLGKARDCAIQALALDPQSAAAHRLLGLISVQEGDSQRAIHLLKRAIESDPNDSDTLSWYSAVCGLSGKAHAAMPLARRILEIDPLTPVYRFIPGLLSLMGGEFADALPSFEDAIRLDPSNTMLLWCRGQILALLRRDQEAISQFQAIQLLDATHFFSQIGAVMIAALKSDREALDRAATPELCEIVQCDPHYAWNFAQCYALTGDAKASLHWIEKAMSKGFINYPMISRWDPLLAPIRQTAHFDSLLDRLRPRWENFEV
ncbi:protein kinase domain-containing protein [Edaphobacter albus]|uniref:protein kinase domain-containing protein n=1 Tax=Edaphobacter sp. 4G125 TaxID=2763071 RepID=UPI00164793BA|nr:protein kinase [Edaphobacter sp. 4G125]QNI36059.1 protein kinase [Edaphobacter sp. 4G125]